jgi:hypothetical protein
MLVQKAYNKLRVPLMIYKIKTINSNIIKTKQNFANTGTIGCISENLFRI